MYGTYSANKKKSFEAFLKTQQNRHREQHGKLVGVSKLIKYSNLFNIS